jgi:hypothetical protein
MTAIEALAVARKVLSGDLVGPMDKARAIQIIAQLQISLLGLGILMKGDK